MEKDENKGKLLIEQKKQIEQIEQQKQLKFQESSLLFDNVIYKS